jgi:hypothetical protein
MYSTHRARASLCLFVRFTFRCLTQSDDRLRACDWTILVDRLWGDDLENARAVLSTTALLRGPRGLHLGLVATIRTGQSQMGVVIHVGLKV